jgi:addiction module HigA family antidote
MPRIAIHPGEHLAEELKALSMSAAELARRIEVPTNRITQILNGARSITGDTALRLAETKAGKAIRALPKLKRSHLVNVS